MESLWCLPSNFERADLVRQLELDAADLAGITFRNYTPTAT
jgi:hypothetical protein